MSSGVKHWEPEPAVAKELASATTIGEAVAFYLTKATAQAVEGTGTGYGTLTLHVDPDPALKELLDKAGGYVTINVKKIVTGLGIDRPTKQVTTERKTFCLERCVVCNFPLKSDTGAVGDRCSVHKLG